MKFFALRRIRNLGISALICGVLFYGLSLYELAFYNEQWLSGWMLTSMVVVLLVYNLRKKLSFLPLGNSATWLQIHVYLGLITFFLFLVHLNWNIPSGLFGAVLTWMFGIVCVVGIVGILLSRRLSKRLSEYGEQLLFERIPGFAQEIKTSAENVVVASVEDTNSTTLADFYVSFLGAHFSAPPRSVFHWLRSERYLFNLSNKLTAQERFMTDNERKYVNDMKALIIKRHQLDNQYAVQFLLKSWLFIHIPLSYSAALMVVIHITLVYAFGAVS